MQDQPGWVDGAKVVLTSDQKDLAKALAVAGAPQTAITAYITAMTEANTKTGDEKSTAVKAADKDLDALSASGDNK